MQHNQSHCAGRTNPLAHFDVALYQKQLDFRFLERSTGVSPVCVGVLLGSIVRARAGGPVSTRPGRPCPLLLRCKVHFQRDIGIK